jgi:hypothetical protein
MWFARACVVAYENGKGSSAMLNPTAFVRMRLSEDVTSCAGNA